MRSLQSNDYLARQAASVSAFRAVGRELYREAVADVSMLGEGRVAEILVGFGLTADEMNALVEGAPQWSAIRLNEGWHLEAFDCGDDEADLGELQSAAVEASERGDRL